MGRVDKKKQSSKLDTVSLEIHQLLFNALILEGEMAMSLYEYELVEHIDYWKDSLKKDNEDFVFVVTVNTGHVAMLLINKQEKLFINESARKQLQKYWKLNYRNNIEMLLPNMVTDLANDCFALTGGIIIK